MESGSSGMETMIKMADMACKHIESVHLIRIDDGMEFTSIEQLEDDKDGSELIGQIGNLCSVIHRGSKK